MLYFTFLVSNSFPFTNVEDVTESSQNASIFGFDLRMYFTINIYCKCITQN